MRWPQLGQRIQWLLRRPGIHMEPVSQRRPRSVRLMRDRDWQLEHLTTTVPAWRGPVEYSASLPSRGLPDRMVSRAALTGVSNSARRP